MDFQHAIVMLSILAVLGGGAVFFIFVIHLYHRMNQRLRETQDYTRQVVDSMANGLLSIDADGRVLSYNNLSLEILGLAQSEIEQFDLNRIIDFQTSGISKTLEEFVIIMDREITITRSGGDELPLAISVTPILTTDNACQGAVIILRDLREIKLLEEKVRRTEKLAALGKLSAAVAHEIRNPLSSIRGFAKFLGHALKDRPKDQEYADVMVKEVDRINRVVTDLLNFASPMELAPEYVNPAELVAHTIRLVEGDAQTRNIIIEVNTENSPESVFLDPYQITQVLLNLMLNALQATGAGQSLNVGVAMNKDSSAVSFWVEDDGPGIAGDHIEKIFDPFFTRREKGTGLGLAIVQKIVENHLGTVQVISPLPGKIYGCRFVISIPMDLKTRI
jgi:two-component system sensor histidine kinase HydH